MLLEEIVHRREKLIEKYLANQPEDEHGDQNNSQILGSLRSDLLFITREIPTAKIFNEVQSTALMTLVNELLNLNASDACV